MIPRAYNQHNPDYWKLYNQWYGFFNKNHKEKERQESGRGGGRRERKKKKEGRRIYRFRDLTDIFTNHVSLDLNSTFQPVSKCWKNKLKNNYESTGKYKHWLNT